MRVRVQVDIRNSLVEGFWVPRPRMTKIWITICYEKLQQFCYSCGRIGHHLKSCRNERLMCKINTGDLRYGSEVGTLPVRPIAKIIQVYDGVLEEGNEEQVAGDGNGTTAREGAVRDREREIEDVEVS